jgi:hypothetical protein
VVAPLGRQALVLTITIEGEQIAGYELVAESNGLQPLSLAVLDE